MAIGGVATGVIVLVKVFKGAKKNPYSWTLPILSIISGLVIDTCKELYQTHNGITRIVYGASVSGLFLIGGILCHQKKLTLKIISSKLLALIFFILPPFIIYLRYSQVKNKFFLEAYKDIPQHILGSIILFFIFLLIIAVLSWIFSVEDDIAKNGIPFSPAIRLGITYNK